MNPLRDPSREAEQARRHADFARRSKIGRYAIGGYPRARRRRLRPPKDHAAR